MKLIAILISIAVVVLVVVGYDLLMKAARKRSQELHEDLQKAFDSYQKQQVDMENLKSKIANEPETKTKSQNKNGK
jgi:Tfp pilus assembly protein PilO